MTKGMRIAAALGAFQGHLTANIGKPIGLSTMAEFSKLVQAIASAVKSDDD